MAFLHWLSQQWLSPSEYAFWSSAWGEGIKDLIALAVVGYLAKRIHDKVHAHLECHVEGCSAWGHPVQDTSFRACKPHHPHLDVEGHSAKHIAHAAKHGHNG